MKPSSEKQELVARLAETRSALSENLSDLGDKANLSLRFRHSFKEHPYTWLAGSVAAGVVVASVFRVGEKRKNHSRKSKRRSEHDDDGIEPSRPLLMGALAFAGNRLMAMSMPAIRDYLQGEISGWLGSRLHPRRDAGPAPDNAEIPAPQSARTADAVRTDRPPA